LNGDEPADAGEYWQTYGMPQPESATQPFRPFQSATFDGVLVETMTYYLHFEELQSYTTDFTTILSFRCIPDSWWPDEKIVQILDEAHAQYVLLVDCDSKDTSLFLPRIKTILALPPATADNVTEVLRIESENFSLFSGVFLKGDNSLIEGTKKAFRESR
jgi:hypothetical protein